MIEHGIARSWQDFALNLSCHLTINISFISLNFLGLIGVMGDITMIWRRRIMVQQPQPPFSLNSSIICIIFTLNNQKQSQGMSMICFFLFFFFLVSYNSFAFLPTCKALGVIKSSGRIILSLKFCLSSSVLWV